MTVDVQSRGVSERRLDGRANATSSSVVAVGAGSDRRAVSRRPVVFSKRAKERAWSRCCSAWRWPCPAPAVDLRYDRGVSGIGLSGSELIIGDATDRGSRVIAVPRMGGPARTILSVPEPGAGAPTLAASGQRVAALIDVPAGQTSESRLYTGPPSGPLTVVNRVVADDESKWTPSFIDVADHRLLMVESRWPSVSSDTQSRAWIIDASGRTPIPWASEQHLPVKIAGSYAAAVVSRRQVAVVELATGKTVATVTGRDSGSGYGTFRPDLEPDGRIAVDMASGIEIAGPGMTQRTVPNSRRLTNPHFAGDAFAAFDEAHHALTLIGPDGSRTTLGPRSRHQYDLDADADGLFWDFNGCLRYAPLGASAPTTGQAGCPQTEVALFPGREVPRARLRGRTARIPVQCISAPHGRCRGRLVVRSNWGEPIIARGRFDLPVTGHSRSAAVGFTVKAARSYRKYGGGARLQAIVEGDPTTRAGVLYGTIFYL